MGGGNGAKSAQRRERNAKEAKGAGKSQLKVNNAALNIQCEICKSTFLQTSRAPALAEHALNKHSKTLPECFPTFQAEAK